MESCQAGILRSGGRQMNRQTPTDVKSLLQLNIFVVSLHVSVEQFFLLKSRDCTSADFCPPCHWVSDLGRVWKIGNRATPVLQTTSQLISFSSALPPIILSSSSSSVQKVTCTLYRGYIYVFCCPSDLLLKCANIA